jgi:Cysteine-rich CWC
MNVAADKRCPRCGGVFHCGAADPQPCACTSLKLDTATLAAMCAQYSGCLCTECLRTLASLTAAPETKKAGPV